MTNDKAKRPKRPAPPTGPLGGQRESKRTKPEWADGLRQLYDSVLNEPLPGSFADLLSKLDESDT
ncbi:NepR family anti-sigma factor [Novosphingobium sp.]|uniref:NepR family anti-sigma factor n=1 Tax=Novosphingobium sp. TaxID=1874826 RepID=UPI0026190205|nr:NepR family anti-sigma factor [Novosphingobium sp.]